MDFLKRLSTWLYRVSTGWITLICFIIFLLFTTLVLPVQAGIADKISQDAGSPDMSFFYTAQELYEMAEAYEEQGRDAYIRARFTFDLIWPLVYAMFLSTSVSWTFEHASLYRGRWRWANLFPLIGMILDYLENISTSVVMYRYPASTDFLAYIAPFLTALKWIFVTASFIILLIGIFAIIWKFFRKHLGEKS
ncbi:hypothetical protein ACFLXI_04220 [Chloroflexota bacterium]